MNQMKAERKYAFSWKLIGDIEKGRPNLGNETRIEIYRLMQFAFRDVVEQHVGTAKTDQIFFEAGKLSGKEFYANLLTPTKDFNTYINQLQVVLKELKIGILRAEITDIANGVVVITVSEDLDCSGLPNLDYELCTYDEGFITSLLECFSGLPFQVKEVNCWATGYRTCRFNAVAIK